MVNQGAFDVAGIVAPTQLASASPSVQAAMLVVGAKLAPAAETASVEGGTVVLTAKHAAGESNGSNNGNGNGSGNSAPGDPCAKGNGNPDKAGSYVAQDPTNLELLAHG